jgi:hypothetical protein
MEEERYEMFNVQLPFTPSKGGRKNENQESLDIHIRVAHREIVRVARENSKGGDNQLSRND